ncbi:ERMES complex Ca(2+)-binding regulatory GTPase gem1 [Dimargaris xerosporica]|nr:ERMES complex Ca(2+)-binding regulatory GTPase gem1 [Dimargaris xerosporica]
MTLIKEAFVANVQQVVPEVTIPPEVTPENVTTHIIDSSVRPECREQLEIEIRKAHVICIVYAVDNQATFNRIPEFWLPFLRSQGVNVPVLLVGNKADRRTVDRSIPSLSQEIGPIMSEFREVETCVECSAKTLTNVSEVFYFAQKAVLHPTGPLYDTQTHTLRPNCERALKRIFKLCDRNQDSVLDDDELNHFQTKCFNAPLQHQELVGVREIVHEHQSDGVTDSGLTEAGFLYLHTLFIQRGRLETTWMVLRKFGYGNDLSLRPDFLLPPFDVPSDCCVELSAQGYQFFTTLFHAHDKDGDGALNAPELADLFSTAPGNPWAGTGFPETTSTNDAGDVTLAGFLAQWSMTTLLDHNTTLAYLAYLGFDGDDTRDGIQMVKFKQPSRLLRERSTRSVYKCLVVGSKGAGKTSLLRGLANKPFTPSYQPPNSLFSAVNSIETKGSTKYLVLQELGPPHDTAILRSRRKLERCDVLCFVYDCHDPTSFAYLTALRTKYDLNHIPLVVVATKGDLPSVAQQSTTATDQTTTPTAVVDPDTYCQRLKLAPPLHISVKEHVWDDLVHHLVAVAIRPHSALPGVSKTGQLVGRVVQRTLAVSLVLSVLAATSLASYRWLRPFVGFLGWFSPSLGGSGRDSL